MYIVNRKTVILCVCICLVLCISMNPYILCLSDLCSSHAMSASLSVWLFPPSLSLSLSLSLLSLSLSLSLSHPSLAASFPSFLPNRLSHASLRPLTSYPLSWLLILLLHSICMHGSSSHCLFFEVFSLCLCVWCVRVCLRGLLCFVCFCFCCVCVVSADLFDLVFVFYIISLCLITIVFSVFVVVVAVDYVFCSLFV